MKSFCDIPYVTAGHDRQTLDLYLPDQDGRYPLIIWIHGGAFRMGSKQDGVPLEYLAEGYALASLNYRLSQHAIFPAQLEDCKTAVRWLRAHAEDYHLDPNRFVAYGPSAGGYLSAFLGVTGQVRVFDVGENLGFSSQVRAVVDLFGPTDFLQMDANRLPDGMVHDLPDSPESELIGGPIQDNQEKVTRANPVSYVTKEAAPFLVIHGDQDPSVPYHQSLLLVSALEEAGVSVTFYTVKGGGHGGFTDEMVPQLIRQFLTDHL
jgi:acetyl esterase/lipase